MAGDEDEERTLRMERLNIEKMRADMRRESITFAVQLVVGTTAVAAASATVAAYLARLQPPPAPRTIVIQTTPTR